MDPVVPLGYPLFLAVTGADAAMLLQPLIFAVALAWLGIEVLAISGSVALALLMQLGIIAIPGLRDVHASILTESLFMSGLVAFLAAAFAHVRAPSWRRAATAAAIVAVTALIRRTGYALLPVLAVMLLGRREERHRAVSVSTLIATLVPLMTVLAADAMVTAVVHGSEATSLSGRHIFAKAALLEAPDAIVAAGDEVLPSLRRALQETFAPVRELIAFAPPAARPTLMLYYETCLQGPCVSALRDALGAVPEATKNAHFAAAGWERVRAAPLHFLRLAATHYALMWTPYHWRDPETAAALTAYVAAHRPLPFEREAFKVTPEEPLTFAPSRAVGILQLVVAAIGWVTATVALAGLAAALWRPATNLYLLAATLAALAAHGCLLFSSLAAAGLARFMISVLPAVVVSLVMTFWLAASALARRRVASPGDARYH